ncbi:nicotinate-nucleotide--dimethylbenzimidazole phosphoribosyltransferase [Enhydrobacter sp.]|jgi:nicotinate-nucleotide--dimethylbenzimidazole phosphoribosyltransferase|uniref:nicotinate-nucleotide--dimethylbenzimidazole phosphoribosyltransferase n=1 Tax=Enhydrobacter sp. TaxID=1894999 RepID=UPI00260EC5A1|nr:nicotinate-nucleotide--dimethylbenzimidazole phosphoribosyltransferase [Enhydrobacter sp.]WIM10889.1 MAG: Nicotinate-nucleotide--dimethylbenzimidazole phosphoribosyltransferase [Enhydrobacter sp.]
MNAPPATFEEMRRVLRDLPGPDLEAQTAIVRRQAELTKPPGSLGRLEEIAEWLGCWQGRAHPRVERARIAVFAGTHGVARRGVSAYPPQVTQQMVQNFLKGGAAINQLAAAIDADLRIYELDLAHPTEDFTRGSAMSEDRAARAMAYGMMAVEPGIDVLCLGEMGIANTTSAAALCAALFGGAGADWAGPGTGVSGSALSHKITVIDEALARHKKAIAEHDPLALLAALGGEEFAAIAGAVLAARMGRIPVLLDGFACTAAAAVLHALDRRALDHCRVAHRSAEPGHKRLLEAIGQRPLLDLDMRLGEASAAALAVPMLKAAVACHNGMATFAEAGVSGKA